MIEIKNLTKIFKTKAKEKTHALDNVSFDIPDTGLVFVLGKSGSGKTTLLSLIGTLDNITSGDIIVDGISLKNIKENDASSYRNEKIAFIYQDYHLIEELTVKENIALSLDLKQEEIGNKIKQALIDVGLENYESRYPKESSGGEKQRIAIARAIVKNSPIILADEPTGNLDTNTSKQIFDLLRKLSKDKLILIVSHDLNSAENYADRIIKLSYGKVIGILKRNENATTHPFIENDVLYLPSGKKIDEEEQIEINKNINNFKSIKWINNDFIKDEDKIVSSKNNEPLKRHHLTFKKSNKLGFKFFKNKIFHTIVVSILIASLINILGLTQIISNYPYHEMISTHLKQQNLNSIILNKDYEKSDEFRKSDFDLQIEKEDFDYFNNLPLKGNVYQKIFMGDGTNKFIFDNLKFNYLPNNLIICDKEYLNNIFNDGNEVDIIYNSKIEDYGYYLTDFNADCVLLKFSGQYKSYNDLFTSNFLEAGLGYKHGYVNGIINTNYKTKYKAILDQYEEGKLSSIRIKKLANDPLFMEFNEMANNFLCTRYSFNNNFVNDYAESLSTDYTWPGRTKAVYNGKMFERDLIPGVRYTNLWSLNLTGNDVEVSPVLYYDLTGIEVTKENYNETFKPIQMNFEIYDLANYENVKPKIVIPVNVVNVNFLFGVSHYVCISEELQVKMNKLQGYTTELYFDNLDDLNLVLKEADKKGFYIDNTNNRAYREIVDKVMTFSDLFKLINYFLAIGILLLLIMIALRTIKDQMHNIGVLKSLGTSNGDLMKIFSIRILSISLLTSLIYLFTSGAFINLADKTLYNSIISNKSIILRDFKLLVPDSKILLINIIFIFLIGLISFIVENIKLSKIKPINIIKAKE